MHSQEVITKWMRRFRSPESDAALADPEFREQVYRVLHPTPTADDRDLLLRLLALEVEYRNDQMNSGEHFESLYWCAFLLSQLGVVDDALPMWRAKHVNFDTACGFDVQFLVGAGVDQTLVYLSGSDDPNAKDAHDYILECRDAGDFDDLASWNEYRSAYFK